MELKGRMCERDRDETQLEKSWWFLVQLFLCIYRAIIRRLPFSLTRRLTNIPPPASGLKQKSRLWNRAWTERQAWRQLGYFFGSFGLGEYVSQKNQGHHNMGRGSNG